jgi:peptide-methionine (S)-S-oxide reductase
MKVRGLLLATAVLAPFLASCGQGSAAPIQGHDGKSNRQSPKAESTKGESTKMEKAAFGAGCFWGVEAAFRQIQGVKSTTVGYEGGTFESPTYQEVCTGKTGHAETVEIEFDPAKVSYDQLLDVFWNNHDPTTKNRQGPDVGVQYRSVIFYHTPEQKKEALASIEKLKKSGKFKRPIVTQVVPASTFWKAEEYHQQYLEKHGLSSCHLE